MDKQWLLQAYEQMHVIRKFEEAIRELYMKGQIRGSFHPCVGQEAVAVGCAWALRPDDYLSCTYRGHGYALAKGMSARSGMAEMLGKANGCAKGKGGSMHFTDISIGLIGGNAIVAGGIPHAAGAAMAEKMKGSDRIALAAFGEGAVNQGVFHESMNLISVWKIPVILICENNLFSEMTPSHETTSTTQTWKRAEAYGIRALEVDGNDIEAVHGAVLEAADLARTKGEASYLEMKTYRLWGHMMGDPEVYRTKEDVEKARLNEPIARLASRLGEMGVSAADLSAAEGKAADTIRDAVDFAQNSPLPVAAEAFTEVY